MADSESPVTVWVVSLEWNRPPSEVTGDTGIVGVFATQAAAEACQRETQIEHDEHEAVYDYSYRAGRYCIACGEEALQPDRTPHDCRNAFPKDAEEFCDHCGGELGNHNTCDNDHDEWDVDVHCTDHQVR